MFDEIMNKNFTPKFRAARTLQKASGACGWPETNCFTMTRTEIEKKESKLQKTELMQRCIGSYFFANFAHPIMDGEIQ